MSCYSKALNKNRQPSLHKYWHWLPFLWHCLRDLSFANKANRSGSQRNFLIEALRTNWGLNYDYGEKWKHCCPPASDDAPSMHWEWRHLYGPSRNAVIPKSRLNACKNQQKTLMRFDAVLIRFLCDTWLHFPCLLCDQPPATAITTRSSVAFIAECPSGCEPSSVSSRLLHRCWSQAVASILSSASRAEPPGPGLTEAPTEPHWTSATFRGRTLSGKCKMLDTIFIQFLLG